MITSKAKRKRVSFQLITEPGSKVSVAGSFNDWDPESTPLKDKANNGTFTRSILLEPGRYEYKFVIDGVWCVDPECREWVPNNEGSLNSVIQIG